MQISKPYVALCELTIKLGQSVLLGAYGNLMCRHRVTSDGQIPTESSFQQFDRYKSVDNSAASEPKMKPR